MFRGDSPTPIVSADVTEKSEVTKQEKTSTLTQSKSGLDPTDTNLLEMTRKSSLHPSGDMDPSASGHISLPVSKLLKQEIVEAAPIKSVSPLSSSLPSLSPIHAMHEELRMGHSSPSDLDRQPLTARPRLPKGNAPERTAQEKALDLETFAENIGRIKDRVERDKPAANAEFDHQIDEMIKQEKTGDISAETAMTNAYNKLPTEVADYWKQKETHKSMTDGLKLIVEKANNPDGYPVHIEKFNKLYENLIARGPEEFTTAVQSLLRLAPNRHDLLEKMVNGKTSATTGINCGKTIASGFNKAIAELLPPEPEASQFCQAVNDKLLADVVKKCMEKTAGDGALPDKERQIIIGNAIAMEITGERNIAKLDNVMTPEAIALVKQTMNEGFSQSKVLAACQAEIVARGKVAMGISKDAASAYRILEKIQQELNIKPEEMFGEKAAEDLDASKIVTPPAILKKLAKQGGLLTESVRPVQDESPLREPSDENVSLVKPHTKLQFPKKLADVVSIANGTSSKDNLYGKENGSFGSGFGFFSSAKNQAAMNTIRTKMIGDAREVLSANMPPQDVENAIATINKSLQPFARYTLANAQLDFTIVSTAVGTAAELYARGHNTLGRLKLSE